MISVEDRGCTRSDRTYLPGYIERIPEPRCQEIFERLANSLTVDVNSISNLMAELTISRRPKNEAENLLENMVPLRHELLESLYFFLKLMLKNMKSILN